MNILPAVILLISCGVIAALIAWPFIIWRKRHPFTAAALELKEQIECDRIEAKKARHRARKLKRQRKRAVKR